MPLSLTPEPTQTLAGTTYYSDSTLGTWRKDTGVYLPPGADTSAGAIDMLLYLHGHLVPSIDQLFNQDGVSVRKQVLASGKAVVLVAPWLGRGPGPNYKTSDIAGNWGELYINDVLNALVPPALAKPDLYNPGGLVPQLHLRRLVIACHSGGGKGMRNLVGTLGRYRSNLKACWGFDCLYGINDKDAEFWYDWSRTSYGRPLYISYGSSTIHESVLLYLMKEGLATSKGARANPDGQIVDSIDVEIGIPTGKYIDDVLGLDKLLLSTTPKPGQAQSQSSDFLDAAIANVRRNAGWPATETELWAMHYRIAREGLLNQLAAASFL